MARTFMIFRHYVRRAALDPIGLLMLLAFPIGLIILNYIVMNNPYLLENLPLGDGGEDFVPDITGAAIAIMLMFQFFGGSYMNDWIYEDFRSDRRWRLFSAPISQNGIIFSALIASWIVSILQGSIIMVVSGIFLGANWGNIWMPVLTVLIVSAMSQFMYILIALLTSKKKTTEAIASVIIFAMMIAGGFFFNLGVENSFIDFIEGLYTPLTLAVGAIANSGAIVSDISRAMRDVGILSAVLVVLATVTAFVGRRRKI